MSRIILFGATGCTGDLTARGLVRQGATPVLVARSEQRVAALAEELGGLDHAVADAGEPASLRAIVEAGDVLISTVGPFLTHGRTAVSVAAELGVHYLDSTGEGQFIREVFQRWGPIAARHDVALLPAFGFDWVPGSLAASLALDEAGPAAVRVEIGYLSDGTAPSGGTSASAIQMMFSEGHEFRGGNLRTEGFVPRVATIEADGRQRTGLVSAATEHLELPGLYPQLQDVQVLFGLPPSQARALSATGRAVRVLRRIPGVGTVVRRALERTNPASTGGPDAATRAGASCTIVARAHDADGRELATTTLHGPDPYEFTGDVLARGAIGVAGGEVRGTGALGPLAAFGQEQLEEVCADAGITRAAS